jgi:Ala-tRNA(Pro) deacylase
MAAPGGIVDQNGVMDPAPPVYAALDALGIAYDRHEHAAVFNADDASRYWDPIGGTQCKNLFLRNKKGDRHYLVVLEISKRADLKDLVKVVGDDRLSFGSPERLMEELVLKPATV